MNDAEYNRYAEDALEMINDNKPVALINEEEGTMTVQYLDDVIKIFPEEARYEDLRSTENRII